MSDGHGQSEIRAASEKRKSGARVCRGRRLVEKVAVLQHEYVNERVNGWFSVEVLRRTSLMQMSCECR